LAAAASGTEEILGVLDGTPVLLIDGDTGTGTGDGPGLSSLPVAPLPCVVVVIARGRPRGPAPAVADVAVTSDISGDPRPVPDGWVAVADVDTAVADLAAQIDRSPEAAVVLAQILRAGEQLDPPAGLLAESLAYSTLQSGPTFGSWLRARRENPVKKRGEPDSAVLVERTGERLTITLHRPHVRNAVNRPMRDELCAALALAAADPSVRSIHLRAAGPAFSSGGDLDEFGTLPDPATAHLVRTGRSPARLLALLGPRVTAHVHGACVGAGIELAAFAHRVIAASDTRFQLPEIGLGLIPGAGGTVSIRRRIGRQRASWMGLAGAVVDVTTARLWGLVDEVADGGPTEGWPAP
jgi:enoyl-CoA hydratase/carnithine racemase